MLHCDSKLNDEGKPAWTCDPKDASKKKRLHLRTMDMWQNRKVEGTYLLMTRNNLDDNKFLVEVEDYDKEIIKNINPMTWHMANPTYGEHIVV